MTQKDIDRQALNFSLNPKVFNISLITLMIMALCLIALMFITLCRPSAPKEVYFYYDPGSKDTIPKEVVTHQILNTELKRLVVEYNATYKDDPHAEGKGLCIHCRIYTDSIYYVIGYASMINYIHGLIICEPVDGKDVSLIMSDLYQNFSLPSERSTEILKNSNPEEYIIHKIDQRGARRVKGKMLRPETLIISDFPEWHVFFDRNQNLLSVYKPKYHRQFDELENNEGYEPTDIKY